MASLPPKSQPSLRFRAATTEDDRAQIAAIHNANLRGQPRSEQDSFLLTAVNKQGFVLAGTVRQAEFLVKTAWLRTRRRLKFSSKTAPPTPWANG